MYKKKFTFSDTDYYEKRQIRQFTANLAFTFLK